MTQPSGLQPQALAEAMDHFGVAEVQVRRDNAISHILAVLSRQHREELIFFGGTALSRTHLLEARLSEDIDLLVTGDRSRMISLLAKDIDLALRRTHGRVTWSAEWSPNSDVEPAVAVIPGGAAIRIQLLRAAAFPGWPTEIRPVEQRYSDAPPATLRVPTLASFAAMKTVAWMDRGAARDLYDLWALSNVGALDGASAALFARLGPTGQPPAEWMFLQPPADSEWRASLAGQTRLKVKPAQALQAVRYAWAVASRHTKST